MIYKILTKNSIDNTNIDGARAEHFNAGMRDGIVKGAFNEGTFTTLASNGISFDTCELRISGHRVVIEEAWTRTFSTKPKTPMRYALIGQIIVGEDSSVQFELFPQLASTKPIKNNLFSQQNGAGTYQVEIGRFTLNTDGNIIDVTRTLDIITGSKGEDLDGTINIGVVKTNTLEPEMDAEADVEQRYDAEQGKVVTDFTFNIPRGKGIEDLDTELSESSTNAVQNNVITTALKNKANLNDDTQTITTGKLVVNNGAETHPNNAGIYVHGKRPTITLKADEDTDVELSGYITATKSGLGVFSPREFSVFAPDGIKLNADAPITIDGKLSIKNDKLEFISVDNSDETIKGTASISYTSDDNTLQADSNFRILENLSVNGNINNDKLDYQLDQSISVTEQSNVFIPVDFNKYDYKLCMWLSVHTNQSSVKNISIYTADNGNIRNSSGRWVYTGVTSNQGNATPSVANYCWQGESNASVFLCDNENNKDRYNRINVELYHSGGQTIDYQSTTSRAYGASFEYKNAGGLIYDKLGTLPTQLCIFNGDKDTSQYLNGNIRVYKRPKFNANSVL